MEKYKHKQTGYVMLWAIFCVAFLSAFNFITLGFDIISFSILIFITLILISFASLTLVIDDDFLRIKFGYGLYKKKFLLKDIKSIRKVRNKWYYGWGIRWWNFIRIYNVSGFDAIEILMTNNRKYRIGTDDLDNLENVLKLSIKQIV